MSASLPTVFLINPPITAAQRNGPLGPVIRNLYFNSPPLGIAYIAAVLEQHDVPTHLVDAAVEDDTLEDTLARVAAIQPDIVGITSTTNFFCNALELGNAIKARYPKIRTIIGGPHVSSNVTTVMAHACFDFACVGEGEFIMWETVQATAAGGGFEDILGLAFRRDGQTVVNPRRPLLEDLDVIPMPARHLLPLRKYVPQPNDGPYLPKAAMISSRGCPFQCIFCDHGIYGNTYRSFGAARIVDEMAVLANRFGMRDIAFVDSLFMMSVVRVTDIIDEMARRQLKVHWTCTIRANIATPDVLAKMKAAGCWRVRLGIESGNDAVLKLIKKQVTKAQISQVAGWANDLGLRPKGFFMIGHPGETAERIRESMQFACSLPLTDVTVQINTPLPGAPQWDMIDDYGSLVTRDLEKYSFWEPVFAPRGMTSGQLDKLHRQFYRRFYFRPVIVWRHLKMLRKWSDVRRYAHALALLIRMFVMKRRKDVPA